MNKWLNQFFKEIEKEKYNDTVMPKMWNILDEVSEKTGFDEHQILMLGLYGSQNYEMDSETSDIDAECFIFPSHDDIVYAYSLYSTCIETQYGTCHIKDIRLAFNELRKSSPNILELLATPYMIVNREYYFLINQFCKYINHFASLDYFRLMHGYEGLFNRYLRDIENPKNFANALRIYDYMTGILCGDDYNTFTNNYSHEYFTKIKYSKEISKEKLEAFRLLIEKRKLELEDFYKNAPSSRKDVKGEINYWQSELMDKYIRLEL